MEETVLNQEANETTAPNAENTPQNEAETAQNPLSELEQAQAEIAEQKDKYFCLLHHSGSAQVMIGSVLMKLRQALVCVAFFCHVSALRWSLRSASIR